MRPVEIQAHHLCVHARSDLLLVRHDDDRRSLVNRVARALGGLLLAFCLMDNHLHVVTEGAADHSRRWLEHALTVHARAFRRRYGGRGGLVEAVDVFRTIDSSDALGRVIFYVHQNPCRTKTPLVERAVDWRWSSARAFAGLSLATQTNVNRAVALLGPAANRVVAPVPLSAELAPRWVPTASVPLVLAAAADVYCVAPADLVQGVRTSPEKEARALFFRLGQLESYSLTQLAGFLGRDRSSPCRALRRPVPDRAVQIARALLTEPRLRAQTQHSAAFEGHSSANGPQAQHRVALGRGQALGRESVS